MVFSVTDFTVSLTQAPQLQILYPVMKWKCQHTNTLSTARRPPLWYGVDSFVLS